MSKGRGKEGKRSQEMNTYYGCTVKTSDELSKPKPLSARKRKPRGSVRAWGIEDGDGQLLPWCHPDKHSQDFRDVAFIYSGKAVRVELRKINRKGGKGR